jgi:hypothetical protein
MMGEPWTVRRWSHHDPARMGKVAASYALAKGVAIGKTGAALCARAAATIRRYLCGQGRHGDAHAGRRAVGVTPPQRRRYKWLYPRGTRLHP